MPVTEYTWNPLTDSVIEETDGAGNMLVEYTNEPAQYGPVLSQFSNGTSQYFHFDALGSTRKLTNNAQESTSIYIYDAWGTIVGIFGLVETHFQWIGRLQYISNHSSPIWVRRRAFVARLSRWQSLDPSLFTDGAHRYRYVKNKPTYLVDPTGLACTTRVEAPAPIARSPYVCWYEDENPGTWTVTNAIITDGGAVDTSGRFIAKDLLCFATRDLDVCYKCNTCCWPKPPPPSNIGKRSGQQIGSWYANLNEGELGPIGISGSIDVLPEWVRALINVVNEFFGFEIPESIPTEVTFRAIDPQDRREAFDTCTRKKPTNDKIDLWMKPLKAYHCKDLT